VRTGGNAVIRQAISCDICGTEKKLTNHWFVAYDQSGELRVSGWSSRNRTRPGSKHLCGQTCLHKLVDDFLARTLSVRVQPDVVEADEVEEQAEATDASLTSNAAYADFESSARLITPSSPIVPKREPLKASASEDGSSFESSARLTTTPLPVPPKREPWKAAASTVASSSAGWKPGVELVAVPGRPKAAEAASLPPDEPPRYRSRNWRAEAWDRERERESRPSDRRPEIVARRTSNG